MRAPHTDLIGGFGIFFSKLTYKLQYYIKHSTTCTHSCAPHSMDI